MSTPPNEITLPPHPVPDKQHDVAVKFFPCKHEYVAFKSYEIKIVNIMKLKTLN